MCKCSNKTNCFKKHWPLLHLKVSSLFLSTWILTILRDGEKTLGLLWCKAGNLLFFWGKAVFFPKLFLTKCASARNRIFWTRRFGLIFPKTLVFVIKFLYKKSKQIVEFTNAKILDVLRARNYWLNVFCCTHGTPKVTHCLELSSLCISIISKKKQRCKHHAASTKKFFGIKSTKVGHHRWRWQPATWIPITLCSATKTTPLSAKFSPFGNFEGGYALNPSTPPEGVWFWVVLSVVFLAWYSQIAFCVVGNHKVITSPKQSVFVFSPSLTCDPHPNPIIVIQNKA